MSRGQLDKSDLARIDAELPDLHPLWRVVNDLSPEIAAMVTSPESTVPTAAVCFKDASDALSEARFAIHEYHAHRIWYRERRDPPRLIEAVFFEKYFLDDVALRLYAAAEHLATAVVCMLEIPRVELKAHKNGRASRQQLVGRYLLEQRRGHPVTSAINKLVESKEWSKTRRYRNDWVHSQPPTVHGLGIVFDRGPRWKGNTLEVGGGDKPRYTTQELFGFIDPALRVFTVTVDECLQAYAAILREKGCSISGEAGGI